MAMMLEIAIPNWVKMIDGKWYHVVFDAGEDVYIDGKLMQKVRGKRDIVINSSGYIFSDINYRFEILDL